MDEILLLSATFISSLAVAFLTIAFERRIKAREELKGLLYGLEEELMSNEWLAKQMIEKLDRNISELSQGKEDLAPLPMLADSS